MADVDRAACPHGNNPCPICGKLNAGPPHPAEHGVTCMWCSSRQDENRKLHQRRMSFTAIGRLLDLHLDKLAQEARRG